MVEIPCPKSRLIASLSSAFDDNPGAAKQNNRALRECTDAVKAYQNLTACSSIWRQGDAFMSKKFAPVICLLLASALPAFPQTSVQGSAQDQSTDLEDLVVRTSAHKGDLDEMDQRRVVRALVTFNRASFFFDNGRPRGMTYDWLVDFEKFLNRKLHPKDTTGKEKINVVLIPTTFGKAAADLQNGNGDLVAAYVYITEERKKLFAANMDPEERKRLLHDLASADSFKSFLHKHKPKRAKK